MSDEKWEKMSGWEVKIYKRIEELEASSASHTEAMEILIQSNNTLNTKVKNNASNLANEVLRLGNEIADLRAEVLEYREYGKNHNESIIELRNLIQGNAISDLNHYEANDREIRELKEAKLDSDNTFMYALQTHTGQIKGLFHENHRFKEVLRELSEGLFSYLGERMSLPEFLKILSSIFVEKLDGKKKEKTDDTKTYHIRLFSPERHFTIFCKETLPTGQYTINIKIEDRLPGGTGVVVKREDLQRWYNLLRNGEGLKVIKEMREGEYGIE